MLWGCRYGSAGIIALFGVYKFSNKQLKDKGRKYLNYCASEGGIRVTVVEFTRMPGIANLMLCTWVGRRALWSSFKPLNWPLHVNETC